MHAQPVHQVWHGFLRNGDLLLGLLEGFEAEGAGGSEAVEVRVVVAGAHLGAGLVAAGHPVGVHEAAGGADAGTEVVRGVVGGAVAARGKRVTVVVAAGAIVDSLLALTIEDSGRFIRWDGTDHPW